MSKKLYVVTDGDCEWSTCIGIFSTRELAEEKQEKYYQKYKESNVGITEVLFEPGDLDEKS